MGGAAGGGAQYDPEIERLIDVTGALDAIYTAEGMED